MKWVRCPSCRTINDVDRYAMCDGCSGDLAGVPELKKARTGTLQHQAARDTRIGDRVILILGGLCLLSLIAIFAVGQVETALLAFPTFLALVIVLWLLLTRTIRHRETGCLIRGVVYLVALIGAGTGAYILVMLACSRALQEL